MKSAFENCLAANMPKRYVAVRSRTLRFQNWNGRIVNIIFYTMKEKHFILINTDSTLKILLGTLRLLFSQVFVK